MAEHTEEFKQAAIRMLERHMEGHDWVKGHQKELEYKVDEPFKLNMQRETVGGMVKAEFKGNPVTILIGLISAVGRYEKKEGIDDMTMLALKERIIDFNGDDVSTDDISALLEIVKKFAEAGNERN